jgi:hypothetical protein
VPAPKKDLDPDRVIWPRKNAKDHSIGYNGHAKCCPCESCAKSHAEYIHELWEENGRFALPKTADSTVFVKSYFRRQPNHFNKRPNFAEAVRLMIKQIRKEKRA